MRPALLIANLGGEESPVPGATSAARTQAAAALWRLLFGRAVRAGEWPEALGPAPEGAAFPWLEEPGEAVAWLVTEAARRAAAAAGRSLAGPPPELVARVHDKAFAIETARAHGLEPQPLRGVATVLAPDELADAAEAAARIEAARAQWPEWLRLGQGAPRSILKPRLGTSGRGRVAFADPTGIEARALAQLADRGGAILEPWLDRLEDFSVQLFLGPEGVLLLGTLEQCVTASGTPRGLRGTLDRRGRVTSGSPHDEALREAAALLARSAGEAGYTGPCGVDAFSFRGPRGAELRPVVELNARFTLGTVAVGVARRVRKRAVSHFDLDANEQLHFHLDLGAAAAAASEDVLSLDLGSAGGRDRMRLRIAREPERLREA